jgi:hypothetical protein
MNAQQRQDAVEDILKYWRDNGHEITIGQALVGELGVVWERKEHDYRLAERLREVLDEEIEGLRQIIKSVEQSPRSGSPRGKMVGRNDLATKKGELNDLVAVWDYYIKDVEAADLAPLYGVGKEATLGRIRRGRKALAAIVGRRAQARVSAMPAGDGQQQEYCGGSDPGCMEAPKKAAPLPSGASGSNEAHIRDSSSVEAKNSVHQRNMAQTFILNEGKIEQLLIGPNEPGDSHASRTNSQKSQNKDLDRLQAALVVLFMLVAMWSVYAAPRISVGAMLLLSGWRAGAYAWRAAHEWRARRTEEIGWSIFTMLAWLTLVGFAIVVAVHLPPILAAPLYSGGRLGLVLRGLCVASGVLLLGIMDFLFWVDQAAPSWGPWRQLKPNAEWAYKQRWEAVSLGWFVLCMLGLVMVMTSVF